MNYKEFIVQQTKYVCTKYAFSQIYREFAKIVIDPLCLVAENPTNLPSQHANHKKYLSVLSSAGEVPPMAKEIFRTP